MTRTRLLLAACLAAVLLVPGTLAAQNKVEQQIDLDLRAMQEQTQQLKLVLNSLLDQIKTVLNSRLDAEASARSKSFADQQALISGINSALSTLQENVRDNKVQVQKLTQELDAIKIGIGNLTTMVIQALSQVPAGAADAPPAEGLTSPAAPRPSAPVGITSAGDFYQPAFSDYTAGAYEMAIKGFEEVIKRFPDSPQAANAQFFIGGSYAYLRKYNEAIVAYDALISDPRFKTNPLTGEALFRQGDCYEQLNQRPKAIERYQLARKDFPGTTGDLLATQALKRLGVLK